MSKRDFWSKFYWGDWRKDARLARCSRAAKGAWMDFLAFVFECDEVGYAVEKGSPLSLQDIAAVMTGDQSEFVELMQELIDREVVRQDERGAYYSKRMAVEAHIKAVRAEAGAKGGRFAQAKVKAKSKQQVEQTSNSNFNSISTSEKKKTDLRFDEFWQAYPRKTAKAEALRRWKRSGCDDIADDVLAGLERCKSSKDWQGRDIKYLPYPATWLNAEGWHDEPDNGGDFDIKLGTTER